MTTIKLTIEYDGTGYVGWQIQPNGPSVQQVVEDALANVAGTPVRVVSSGRTDAGVHARGMVAHFTTDRDLPLSAWREGANAHLPPDIAIIASERVADDFHARYDALAKRYRYTIDRGSVRSPLNRLCSWHIKGDLDVAAMNRAAASLLGEHDFAAFRAAGCDAKTTVRTVYAARFRAHGRRIHFDIVGSGFLRNMVRIIVGSLIEIGLGKREPGEITRLLQAGSRAAAGVTAPPRGLCLMKVWYDGSPGDWTAFLQPCFSCQKSLDKHR